jgi:hypothetical protein
MQVHASAILDRSPLPVRLDVGSYAESLSSGVRYAACISQARASDLGLDDDPSLFVYYDIFKDINIFSPS